MTLCYNKGCGKEFHDNSQGMKFLKCLLNLISNPNNPILRVHILILILFTTLPLCFICKFFVYGIIALIINVAFLDKFDGSKIFGSKNKNKK